MSIDEERILKAGDYRLEEIFLTNLISGDSLNLKNFTAEINLFEDVFSPVMFGNVIISDGLNVITEFPILGNELLTLKLRTPTLEDNPTQIIQKTFQLYAIEDRVLATDRQQDYRLCFMSREGLVDQCSPISKSFKGVTSDIVDNLYTEYLQTPRLIENTEISENVFEPREVGTTGLVVGDTDHISNIRYVSNFWTPFRNINFISKYAKGATLNSTDFTFFESNKFFYFCTLEWLIAMQLKQGLFDEYVYEPVGVNLIRRQGGYVYNSVSLPPEFTKIEDITIPKTMDILEGQDSGFYANGVRAYNFTTREQFESNFDFREQMKKMIRTDAGIAIPAYVDRTPYSNVSFVSLNSHLFDDYSLQEDYIGNVSFRTSYSNSFNQFKFRMDVPGRTDIEVGRVINLLFPTPKAKEEEFDVDPDNAFDPILSGPYLITAIHHKFDVTKHSMTMEIVKNGIGKSLGEEI